MNVGKSLSTARFSSCFIIPLNPGPRQYKGGFTLQLASVLEGSTISVLAPGFGT